MSVPTNKQEILEEIGSEYADTPYDELLAKLDGAVAEVSSLAGCMTNDELYKIVWDNTKSSGCSYTFGRIIYMNTTAPFRNARARLRRGMEEKL